MANDLVTSIEAFTGGPSQAFAALNPHDDNLSDGIGSSYGVIGYKGKVWSLRHRGEKRMLVRPDDGTPASYIDVVVLQQAKTKSKSYYEQYDPAGTSEGAKPICASLDGVVPDADVQQKQADTCALCPRNEWKTQRSGKKGRECQDYKRLAVLLMPVQTQAIYGEPLMEPVFLRVPPASLNNLALLGEQMAGRGYHYSSYITRISFDPAKPHPEMVFRALQKLTDDEAPVVLPLRDDPQALRIIGANITRVALAAPAAQKQEALAAPGTHPTGLTTSGIVGGGGPPSGTTPSALPATPNIFPTTAPSTAKSTTETPASGAFGGVIDVPIATDDGGTVQKLPPQSMPQQTVADTGEPDEADAALDARIAQLMPKLAS